jgi:hypothetical protein
MRAITEYVTVSKLEVILLDRNVNERIQTGWQPYGDPYLFGNFHCQAMVKFAETLVDPPRSDASRAH